jgi:ribosomal-protein-serine acetyltransferase
MRLAFALNNCYNSTCISNNKNAMTTVSAAPIPANQATPALSPLAPSHAPALLEAVLEIANDPRGHNLWWVNKGYTLADAHAFIARAVVLREQNLAEVFAIDQDGVLLGLANAKSYDWVHGCFQGGYWLRPSARGRGAATVALKELGKRELARGMLRMELLIGHDNERSQAVAKRAGAQYEGRLRNRLIVSDVRKDAALLAIWLPDLDAAPKSEAYTA